MHILVENWNDVHYRVGKDAYTGGNRKWIVWEAKHRLCIFRINIKGFATWFSTLCGNFESKFEKITRTKQKDRRLFLCPLYALFPMECSLPKVLQKCFLTQIKTLDSLWKHKLHKIVTKTTRNSLESKTQTLFFQTNYSKLALKNYVGALQHGLPYSV